MPWTPNDREIESVLGLATSDRYMHFVRKVADQQELWSLWSDGWMLASDDAGRELIPVWPHQKYAAVCATGRWEGSAPKAIELKTWLERWIDGAKRDGRLFAVFPTPESRGAVVEPDRLSADIELELTRYE